MDILKIAICDDDIIARKVLVELIRSCDADTQCTSYASAGDFLSDFISGRFDLIIMDIYMEGMSGIDAISAIRSHDSSIPVAFATSSLEHALESYRLGALMYLEKPITQGAIQDLLKRTRAQLTLRPMLRFSLNHEEKQITLSSIQYLEQNRKDVLLHLWDGSTLQFPDRLERLLPQFAEHPFFRSHKSYLVNLEFVRDINLELMTYLMQDGTQVHISRQNLSAAKQCFKDYRSKQEAER